MSPVMLPHNGIGCIGHAYGLAVKNQLDALAPSTEG